MEKLVLLFLAIAVGTTHAIRCLSCDTATESSCAYSHNDTLTVPTVECAAEVGQCFVSVIDAETNRVFRGCRDEQGDQYCMDYGCFNCPWDDCNDIQYIEEKCTSCTSNSANNFCEWNVADNMAPVICPDTTEERSGCFLQIKGNQYTRDCVANLDDEAYENCVSGDDCKICKGDNCNSKEEFQRCYTCDSEADENCVYLPDGAYIKQCEKYDDTCLSFAVANGKTGRGCTSEVNTEPTYCPGTNCAECSGVECNHLLVPTYRITCYQCTDSQFGCTYDQEMFKSFQRACKNFNFQDQCYIYEDETNFYRGCMSDDSEQSQICALSPEKCTICSESDCNKQALLKESTLSCHKCKGVDCMADGGPASVKCQSQVQPGDVESCYYTQLVGGDIQMGCLVDEATVCKINNCLTCTEENCNSIYIPKKSQLVCHKCMDTDENCAWRQREQEVPTYCESMVLHDEVDSCYFYKYAVGDYRRGCLKDDRFFCYGHDCKTCTGNYCNSEAKTQSCIQCDSSKPQFETCAADAKDLNSMVCPQEAFLEDAGCYSVKKDDVVIRGCWNEVSEEHKTFCAANEEENCVRCEGEGCNNHDHSGSANLIVAIPTMLVSAMVAIILGQ